MKQKLYNRLDGKPIDKGIFEALSLLISYDEKGFPDDNSCAIYIGDIKNHDTQSNRDIQSYLSDKLIAVNTAEPDANFQTRIYKPFDNKVYFINTPNKKINIKKIDNSCIDKQLHFRELDKIHYKYLFDGNIEDILKEFEERGYTYLK